MEPMEPLAAKQSNTSDAITTRHRLLPLTAVTLASSSSDDFLDVSSAAGLVVS